MGRRRNFALCGLFALHSWLACVVLLIVLSSQAAAFDPMRLGSRGEDVKSLQEALDALGYLVGPIDGIFGEDTHLSVISFQMQHGIRADGVVGPQTQQRIDEELSSLASDIYKVQPGDCLWSIATRYSTSVRDIASANGLDPSSVLPVGMELRIPASGASGRGAVRGAVAMPWSIARNVFGIGSYATVIDVKTGIAFRVKRLGGHYHADSEPATSNDTAALRRIYGGSWSWARRAVVVVVGGQRIAASINGMPHGEQSITNNGFSGHFCIHFLDSRIHKTGAVDPDHQAMVRMAIGL